MVDRTTHLGRHGGVEERGDRQKQRRERERQGGEEAREGGGNKAHRGEEQLLVTRSGAKQARQQQHFVVQMREVRAKRDGRRR